MYEYHYAIELVPCVGLLGRHSLGVGGTHLAWTENEAFVR